MTSIADPLVIGSRTFSSRLLGGTGKYVDFQQTREAIDAAMPFAGRYVLEAAMTISVLRAGLSVMEVPCNFAHSGADRSLGSLNRPARMFDAVRATVSQLFHSDARSKRRADHEQGIGVPYPAPASAPAPVVIVKKKGPGWVALLGAMLLTIGLTLGAMLYMRPELLRVTTPQNLNNGTVATVPASSDATGWTAVASAVSPAVVTIQSQNASSGGTGSGVIYDAQSDIVTNYHVISPAINGGQIQVTLADGRLYGAGIVGHDKTTDLAVIRLENPPSDLTVARFALSQSLQVGAPVMAIGAPLGLSNTVTTGIVSALNRPVEVSMDEDSTSQDQTQASSDLVVTNAIQIDASINPGNSGGPLFDATGAVIGINSSIKSLATSADGQAGSIGLGFAIPSDLVVSIADQLITTGSASHGMLGVTVKAATATVGSDTYVGAQVQEVSSGSGAAAAGLRSGDVILKVEGQEVTSPKQLIGYVRRYRAGDTINLTIARDGATRDVSVTIQGS